MTALLGWVLTLFLVVMLHGMTLAIPGNTGYPDMGTSPGGSGGAITCPHPQPLSQC